MKDKYQTIFQYQSVMAWVRSLLNDGIITQSEYNVMSYLAYAGHTRQTRTAASNPPGEEPQFLDE